MSSNFVSDLSGEPPVRSTTNTSRGLLSPRCSPSASGKRDSVYTKCEANALCGRAPKLLYKAVIIARRRQLHFELFAICPLRTQRSSVCNSQVREPAKRYNEQYAYRSKPIAYRFKMVSSSGEENLVLLVQHLLLQGLPPFRVQTRRGFFANVSLDCALRLPDAAER